VEENVRLLRTPSSVGVTVIAEAVSGTAPPPDAITLKLKPVKPTSPMLQPAEPNRT
jgi:hypothetical protein